MTKPTDELNTDAFLATRIDSPRKRAAMTPRFPNVRDHATYAEYCDEMVRLNPRNFLPVGVLRRWWHWKLQHPRTAPRA